jgi:hypothetical protein
MNDQKYAITTWGQELTQDLTTPSGQMCQVRMPGVQSMIAAGVLESADTLGSLIDEKHIKRVQGKGPNAGKPVSVDTQGLMKNPEQLAKVFEVVDKVVEHMVLQPAVQRPIKVVDGKDVLLTFDEREDHVVYTDRIDLMDKMFIFQYAVGGSSDVESFRKQFAEGMGGVAAQ